MKKLFIYSIIALSALASTSCKHDVDLIFDKSAAVRLNEASDLYSARLMAQPNGWAMQLYPTLEDEAPYGSGYLVLMRFNDNKSVYAAMNNTLTGNQFKEDTSAWDIITDDGPVLSFDTYNEVIHTFSNPESYATSTKIGQTHDVGVGIGGDYEFIIVDAPEDASYMMLKGKKRATYNLLTPVAENVVYEDYLADVKAFHNEKFPYPLKIGSDSTELYSASDLLHMGDSVYSFEDANGGVPSIYPYGGDKVTETFFDPFLVTKRGDEYYMRFRDQFTKNNQTVQEFRYDAEQDIFVSTDNENCYIEGGKAMDELKSSLGKGYKWQTNVNSYMSEAFASRYNKIIDEFKAAKYTFVRFIFKYSDNHFVVTAVVKNAKGSTANLVYNYDAQFGDSDVTLAFNSYGSSAAENIFSTSPALKEVIDMLKGTLTVSPVSTAFNLSKLKFSKSEDDWFSMSLDKDLNK